MGYSILIPSSSQDNRYEKGYYLYHKRAWITRDVGYHKRAIERELFNNFSLLI